MPRKQVSCSAEVVLDVLAGRWKVLILRQLLDGMRRFNQLQRELPGITHRILAKQLREMENQGLVLRKDHKEVPPRVEYWLSPLGLTLKDILMAMHTWGEKYGDRVRAISSLELTASRRMRSGVRAGGAS